MNLHLTAGFEMRPRRRTRLAIAAGVIGAFALAPCAQASEAAVIQYVGDIGVTMAPASGLATYYIGTSTTGWGAAGCPNAYWGYFYSDKVGSRDMYATIMQAKQMGKKLYFIGTCAGATYFQIEFGQAVQ